MGAKVMCEDGELQGEGRRGGVERLLCAMRRFLAWLVILSIAAFILYPLILSHRLPGIPSNDTGQPPDTGTISALVFNYTNDERVAYGLEPLQPDANLEAAALWHSECLSANAMLVHESAQCGSLESRYGMFGISALGGGENLARDPDAEAYYSTGEPTEYRSHEEIAGAIVGGWMNSTGHRANILDSRFTHMGVGVYYNQSNHSLITTQNFLGR